MKAVGALEYWSRAEAFGDDFEGSPCMVLPNKPEKSGYVRLRVKGKNVPAHRFIYEALVGPIPEGHDLDHRCAETNDIRACVNPWHTKPATTRENVLRGRGPCAANARKTHCVHSHPLSGENLVTNTAGERRCRTCQRMHTRKSYHRNLDANRRRAREWARAKRARTG